VFFIVGRFFGGGEFCGGTPSRQGSDIDDLKKEIQALGNEVRELKTRRRIEIMKSIASFTSLLIFLALSVSTEDMVKDFTFKTIDGETISYRSLRGAPLVINVGAHW
jgi:hypothetical protein